MYLTANKEKTIRRIINYVVFMGLAVLLFVVIGLIPFFYEIWYNKKQLRNMKSKNKLNVIKLGEIKCLKRFLL